MRLLNAVTRQLKEFQGINIPSYAILSHRWEDEEVTFPDLANVVGLSKKGWGKIEGCCRQAVLDDFQWVWIDSCCIDKTSSAELSEAINSMFRWYRESKVCYAYLSDAPTITGSEWNDYTTFRDSQWFTRGWTLQELLAPPQVVFFDRDWVDIGTKGTLEKHISFTTGIKNISRFEESSVAQKFSWASKRQTTREEDEAYCLMGLFSVNMPALYGEGRKAFLRLQLEILKQSDDESIFAWTSARVVGGGVLAPSPSAFMDSGDIEEMIFYKDRDPYAMTNKGLRMSLSLIPQSSRSLPRFLAPLNCRREKQDLYPLEPLATSLLKDENENKYFRSLHAGLTSVSQSEYQGPNALAEKAYLIEPSSMPESYQYNYYHITVQAPVSGSLELSGYLMAQQFIERGLGNVLPLMENHPDGPRFTIEGSTGGVIFTCLNAPSFVVIVDTHNGGPGLHIRTRTASGHIVIAPDPAFDPWELSNVGRKFANDQRSVPRKSNAGGFSNLSMVSHSPPYLYFQYKHCSDFYPNRIDSSLNRPPVDAEIMQGPNSRRRLDRISVPLEHGKMVTAVLKPRKQWEATYVAEVTIDQEGVERKGRHWPILS